MVDTFTTRTGAEKPEVNANDGTWGTELNASTFDVFDEAIHGVLSVSLTAGNVTLTVTNGTAGGSTEARNPVIILTGTPGAARTVTFPDIEGKHWVRNNSDSTATLSSGAGTTVVLPAGVTGLIYNDGATNTVALWRSFIGAMAKRSADLVGGNFVGGAVLGLDAEAYDIGGWHDTAVNNERHTVPNIGITRVRFGANIFISDTTADTWKKVVIRKNGSAAYDGVARASVEIGATDVQLSISGTATCVAADYFDVAIEEESDNSVTITAAQTNFWIEAVWP